MTKNKKVKMLRCPSCGALYEEGLLHCPYCRSVDDYQDESEYLEDMDELREKLEDIPETAIQEHKKRQKTETVRDIRKVLAVAAAAAAAFLLVIGIMRFLDRTVLDNSEEDRIRKQREEYLWKQENFAKLDEMYEKKDYEGLLAFARENRSTGIYDWDHYPLVEALEEMEYLRDEISYVDNFEQDHGYAMSEDLWMDNNAMLLRYELELLYFDKREAEEADKEIVKELAAGYLEDLDRRYALTPEELAVLGKEADRNRGIFYISYCEDFLKNR